MRKYRPTAATPVRLEYGIELAGGLGLFAETKPLATGFVTLNDDLEMAYETRRDLRKPLAQARVKVRFGNYAVDRAIRACAKAAEIADGARRGPIFKALFPDGVGVVVAPLGARQIPPTQALLDRMVKSRVAGMDTFRAEWQPKLSTELTALESSAAEHDAAQKAYLDAFGTELALRQEHYLAIDKIAGAVRTAFPGDKARQDLVFPVIEEAEAEAEEAAPAPADAGGNSGGGDS